MAKKLRRFKMDGLPKLARAHVQLINALLWRLPSTLFEAGFKDRMRDALEPIIHADVDVWFDGARRVQAGEAARLLAEPTCAAVIGLTPRTDKAVIEIDLALVQMCIDKILGGSTETADTNRPLSEIEDGVFSFVLLKVLHLLQIEAADEHALTLKLESVHGAAHQLKDRVDLDGAMVVLSFKLFFDVKVGFMRLYVPESLVADVFSPTPPAAGPARDRQLRRFAQRANLIRAIKTTLSVEVGRISFSMADLQALEVEDIILVEETEVRLEGSSETDVGVLSGRVHCRVGANGASSVQGIVQVSQGGRYEVAIEGISPMGEPRPPAFLFAQSSLEDGNDMAKETHEDAILLSAAGLVDARALAARMRGAQLHRFAAATLSTRQGAAEPDDACEHSDPDDDDAPSQDAAQLLEDVTVSMSVELGRVTVSAADVMGLRAGQVIELSRQPGAPVDLVVDGKRIGKGELVEIDGELGVRILSLAK